MQPSRASTKRPTLELGAVLPHSNTPHHSAWPDSRTRTKRLVRRMMRIARVAKDLHGRGGSISPLAPPTMGTSLLPKKLTLMRVVFTRSTKNFLPGQPPPQAELLPLSPNFRV